METDPLRQGWQSFAFKVFVPGLSFSRRAQELGSDCAKLRGRSVTMFLLFFILHTFPFILSVPIPRSQANILSFCFQRQASCPGQFVDLSLESSSRRSSMKGSCCGSGSQRAMSSLKSWSSDETSVTRCQTYSRTKLGIQHPPCPDSWTPGPRPSFLFCVEHWEKATGHAHTCIAHFSHVLPGVRDLEIVSTTQSPRWMA